MDYTRWEADFSRLQGIIGKCLDEEIPGTMARNPDVLHAASSKTTRSRSCCSISTATPATRASRGEHYFPGHWIHRAAIAITADVPAEAGETVIQVENSRDFKVDTGRYQNVNDDIALFGITAEGSHDWSHCEQVQLIAVDHAGRHHPRPPRLLRHQTARLQGRPSPRRRPQVEGPWGKNNHLLWFYNFTDHCPRDAGGKTAPTSWSTTSPPGSAPAARSQASTASSST